jgi:hypothetical protein
MVSLMRQDEKTTVLDDEVSTLSRLFGGPPDPAVPVGEVIGASAEPCERYGLSLFLGDVLDAMSGEVRVAQWMTHCHFLIPRILLITVNRANGQSHFIISSRCVDVELSCGHAHDNTFGEYVQYFYFISLFLII